MTITVNALYCNLKFIAVFFVENMGMNSFYTSNKHVAFEYFDCIFVIFIVAFAFPPKNITFFECIRRKFKMGQAAKFACKRKVFDRVVICQKLKIISRKHSLSMSK